jgi:hypothetical protein
MGSLVDKWGGYGLLDGIENYGEKFVLATKYERMALHILDLVVDMNDQRCNMIFPILYRVFKGVEYNGRFIRNNNVSVIELWDSYTEFYNNNWRGFESTIQSYFTIDVEAEFISYFVEYYFGLHKKELIKKKLKIHTL